MRARHRLLRAATLASVVLLVLTLTAAARSYVRRDFLVYGRAAPAGDEAWSVSGFAGAVTFAFYRQDPMDPPIAAGWRVHTLDDQVPTELRWRTIPRFDRYPLTQIGTVDGRVRTTGNVTVPYWSFALVTAALPTARLVAAWRSRRPRRRGFDVTPAG